MQRPRRTSQLHDEQVPNVRGQSRQSRIAVRTRSPSAELQVYSNGALFTSALSPCVPRGTTPQRTPLTKTLLSTAEKYRNTYSTNSLHNDKKWIQEQTIRITEHLISIGTVGGMSTNFLSRGLRQISIKQFVAIVNYFLGNIGGNRFTIGSNYVEDIINVLQKLQYPFPINKSWLKTPNAKHSFGNVIQLLDFLMEFVPHSDCSGFEIEVVVNSQTSTKQNPNEEFKIPDKNFQEELLNCAKQSFLLWDKQILDSYAMCQRQACDIFISKYCGVQDTNAAEKEISQMKLHLSDIEKELPPKDDKIKKFNMGLLGKIDFAKTALMILKEDLESNCVRYNQLLLTKEGILKDIENLKHDIHYLQENIKSQLYTVEQRDELITDIEQLKLFVAIEERTVVDLENRDHNQQVLLSRAIKQFAEVIEQYNLHMRNIAYSEAFAEDIVSYKNLKLSLRLDENNMKERSLFLNNIKGQLETKIENNNNLIKQLKQKNDHLNNAVITKLEKEFNVLTQDVTNIEANQRELNHQMESNEIFMNSKYESLNDEVLAINKTIEDISIQMKATDCQVKQQKMDNEKFYIDNKTKIKKFMDRRKSFLFDFNKKLENFMNDYDVEQLFKRLEIQRIALEELTEHLQRRRGGGLP